MSVVKDIRGLEVTGLNRSQMAAYDQLLEDLYLYRPGVQSRLEALLEEAPEFILGHLLRGYSLMTDGLKSGLVDARRFLNRANELSRQANQRELLHMQVLQAWVDGRSKDRAQLLEEILLRWPLDLLAYRQHTGQLFWTGDKRRQLAAATQALPHWNPKTPGYHLMLGPLAFALEEAGQYELATHYARQALAVQPIDLWALHAMAHVHEMQGRPREGDRMISEVAGQLKDFNLFRGHLWWHLALFRFAQRRYDEVLTLWDEQILPGASSFYLDIQNAASLLARLEIQGIQVGDRWERVADSAEQTLGQHLIAFTAPHQAMALARSGRGQALAMSLVAMGADAKREDPQGRLALAVAEAISLYYKGAHLQFLGLMRRLRYDVKQLGASHAQQDVFHHLMVDAALQLQDLPLAKSLLKERLAQQLHNATDWDRYATLAVHIERISDVDVLRRLLHSGLAA